MLWVVLFTLAFGVKWNKTWSSLKATPAYLQDLFYRNVPEGMSDFDRTAPVIKRSSKNSCQKVTVPVTAAPEHNLVEVDPVVRDHVAERLFEDFADKESHQPHHYEEDISEPVQASVTEPVQHREAAGRGWQLFYIPMKSCRRALQARPNFLLTHLQLHQQITMLMK